MTDVPFGCQKRQLVVFSELLSSTLLVNVNMMRIWDECPDSPVTWRP